MTQKGKKKKKNWLRNQEGLKKKIFEEHMFWLLLFLNKNDFQLVGRNWAKNQKSFKTKFDWSSGSNQAVCFVLKTSPFQWVKN